MSKTPRNVALSKARLDAEIREIVKKVSHRPRAEIIQIVRDRTHAAIDLNYLETLLREGKANA